MRKVLVIGAGAQSGPCTSILVGEDEVEEIRLGEIDLALAQKVAAKVNSEKVHPIKLDASNKAEVVAAAQGADVVIDLTHLKFNDNIMAAALDASIHYVDTASNTAFLENWISDPEPKLHREFKGIGKTALIGCGFSSGIANVLTRYACDQMQRVDKIIIRVGRKGTKDSDEVVSEWKPTWSPEILLEDYAEPPMLLIDSEFVQVPIFRKDDTQNARDSANNNHTDQCMITNPIPPKSLMFGRASAFVGRSPSSRSLHNICTALFSASILVNG